MKQVEVIVASRGRIEKLYRLIDTIPVTVKSFDKDGYYPVIIRVIADGCKATFDHLQKLEGGNIKVHLLPEQRGSVKARNYGFLISSGIVIYAVDDIVFNEGAIQWALSEFKEFFPDGDGLLGFNQKGNNKFNPAGVGMVGQKFIKRFSKRQVLCPFYYHFAIQELHEYAVAKKLFRSSSATVYHYNPYLHEKEMDLTHNEARVHKGKDMALMKARKKSGTIWGMN